MRRWSGKTRTSASAPPCAATDRVATRPGMDTASTTSSTRRRGYPPKPPGTCFRESSGTGSGTPRRRSSSGRFWDPAQAPEQRPGRRRFARKKPRRRAPGKRDKKVHRVVAKSASLSKISTPPVAPSTPGQENFGTGAVAGPYGRILQIATSVPHERSWHTPRRENRTTRAWIPPRKKKAQVRFSRNAFSALHFQALR